MIQDNSAALIVSSTTVSVSTVSAKLDLEPTASHEMGELTESSRPDAQRFERDSRWVFEVDDDDPDSGKGFGSVRRLLDALAGREGRIRALRPEFQVWIGWTGFSDSATGGFVIPHDVFSRLAELECDIVANADLIPET